MEEKQKKKRIRHVLSQQPYFRHPESEMMRIVKEIQSGILGIRASSRKYGICRRTLQNWIIRFSVSTLDDEISNQLFVGMNEDQQTKALIKKVKELTKALDYSRLKADSLETMIKVAEEDLQIKIRKKPGTKQSKE
jgi:transposase-like protein